MFLECLKNWRQCQWKIDVAKGDGLGSTSHRLFLYGQYKIFERLWTRLTKKSV